MAPKLHEQFLLALVLLIGTLVTLSFVNPETLTVLTAGVTDAPKAASSSFATPSFSASVLWQLPRDALTAIPSGFAASQLQQRCRPSEACVESLTRFYLDHGDGFFVGGSGALKWLTDRMGPALVDLARTHSGGRVVALDIGAGKYGPEGGTDDSDSLLLLGEVCQLDQNCEVHAFEAIPEKAAQLEHEVQRRPKTKPFASNYFVHHKAVSNVSSGTVKLYPPGSFKSMNNYKVAATEDALPDNARQHAIDVPVTSLDTFLEARGLLAPGAVSYVKIDIEGGEVNALRGARRALQMGAISVMSFEYGFQWSHASRRISLAHTNRRKMRANIMQKDHIDIFTPEGAWKHGPMQPRETFGDATLLRVSQYLDALGYDVYLLNSRRSEKHAPVLVPVSHGHFLEPMSELCLYEPSIFDPPTPRPAAVPSAGGEGSGPIGAAGALGLLTPMAANNRGTVRNCWTDAIAVRRGEPKRVFMEAFSARSREHFAQCDCF